MDEPGLANKQNPHLQALQGQCQASPLAGIYEKLKISWPFNGTRGCMHKYQMALWQQGVQQTMVCSSYGALYLPTIHSYAPALLLYVSACGMAPHQSWLTEGWHSSCCLGPLHKDRALHAQLQSIW